MPDVLVAAAILSLLFAVLMTVIAAKLLRENRARTSSRIEALQALAAAPAGSITSSLTPRTAAIPDIPDIPTLIPPARTAAVPDIPTVMPAARSAAASTPIPISIPTTPRPSVAAMPHIQAPTEIDDWDFDLRDEDVVEEPLPAFEPAPRVRRATYDIRGAAVEPSHDLFEAPIEPAPSRRWTWMAAAVVVMLLGGGTFWIVSSGVISRAIANHEANVANANALPLELLSLRYVADTAGFVVTGLVQNPEKSVAQRGVVAVVYLFDGEGKYIASSRSSLESAVLSAGGESGFVVHLPASSDVSKYRVSFQHEDGAAVPHVDRRGSLPANTTGDAIGADLGTRASLSGTVVRK